VRPSLASCVAACGHTGARGPPTASAAFLVMPLAVRPAATSTGRGTGQVRPPRRRVRAAAGTAPLDLALMRAASTAGWPWARRPCAVTASSCLDEVVTTADAVLAAVPYARTLGVQFVEIGPGQVVAAVRFSEDLSTVGGGLHGGVLMGLADVAAAVCAVCEQRARGATGDHNQHHAIHASCAGTATALHTGALHGGGERRRVRRRRPSMRTRDADRRRAEPGSCLMTPASRVDRMPSRAVRVRLSRQACSRSRSPVPGAVRARVL